MTSLSFDPNKSFAILIGISEYENLPSIRPITNNVIDLSTILADNKFIGIPEQNIFPITNKRNDLLFNEIDTVITDIQNKEGDLLIFYYSGHGIREAKNRELYLTGTNSKHSTIQVSGLPFNIIKEFIENSNISKTIILIDSCYSGLAAMDDAKQLYSESELDIKGSYLITSSTGVEKSFFEKNMRNTFFTGGLLEVIKNGVGNESETISLDALYNSLKNNQKHSSPQRKTNLNISDFRFCYNITSSQVKKTNNGLATDNRTDNRISAEYYFQKGIESTVSYDKKEFFKKAISLNSNFAEAYYALGKVFVSEDRYPEAIEIYEKAISLNNNFSEAYNALGKVLYYDKKYYESIAMHEKAIQINPDYIEAYSDLSHVYWNCNNYEMAIKYGSEYHRVCLKYDKNHDIGIGNAVEYKDWAVSEALKGNFSYAIELLKKAIEDYPEYDEAHSYLALYNLAQGNLVGSAKSIFNRIKTMFN